MNKSIYENIAAFHPGYYVKDIIEDMEITQDEFALRLNTTPKTLSKLVNGEIQLSKNLAENLSLLTGTSISVWLNLQTKYEIKMCEIECEKNFDLEKEYLDILDYDYFVNTGVVSACDDKVQRIKNLCSTFAISKLQVLEDVDLLTACKTSITDINRENVVNANAWIQLGKSVARKIFCADYSQKKLLDSIPFFRSLTLEKFSEAFPKLKKKLSECGVLLVALPYMKNSGLSGAVQWLTKNKVMLLINDRGKDTAKFWFTLFHEIRHILQRKVTFLYLRSEDKNSAVLSLGRDNREEEKDADNFAREQLIPTQKYSKFISSGNFSLIAIKKFAADIGINHNIVIGRLKHDGFLNWNIFAKSSVRYEISFTN